MDAGQFKEMLDKMLPSDQHYGSQQTEALIGQIRIARQDMDENESDQSWVADEINEKYPYIGYIDK